MIMSTEVITQLISLYKNIPLSFSNNNLIGKNITIDENSLVLIKSLESQGSNFVEIDVQREGPNVVDSIIAGEELLSLEIKLHRSGGFFFGKNLADLLQSSSSKYCYEKPALCYLAEENWKSWEEGEQKQSIHAYLGVLNFIMLLKNSVADHEEETELHFFGSQEKLSVPLIYDANSIETAPGKVLDALAVITKLMEGEKYKKDKGIQLKAIIIDILISSSKKDRFNKLIKCIDQLSTRFSHNHDLFVSGFSFEDNKEKLKGENRKYTAEMNTTINSIHTRVIGIPIGTLGAALLMKTKEVSEYGLGFVLLFSSVFIVIVIFMSLMSQLFLLIKIRAEYREKWNRMETKIPNLLDDLKSEFTNLERHYYLNTGLIIFFFLALVFFSYYPLSVYFDFSIVDFIKVYLKS